MHEKFTRLLSCTVSKQCHYDGSFKCNDTGVCLRPSDRCDGYSECQRLYGSDSDYDEQNCGMHDSEINAY